ncbi:MAG: hypothetical protein AAGD01_05455 [Acidobacteriota bacterium]
MKSLSALTLVALGVASSLSFAAPAEARWADGPRPSRAEMPVPKAAEIPVYKNTVADAPGDTFGDGTVRQDLQRLAAEIVGSDLVISLIFYHEISAPDSGNVDALDGFIDLDLDQDGTTGDVPWTDLLRPDDGTSTGMGNEAYVDLFSYDENGNVELINDANDQLIGLVPLSITFDTARVHIPLNYLNGDRNVDVAAVVGTFDEPTDIAPNQGSVTTSSGSSTVLLQGQRFRVDIQWKDFQGNEGFGRVSAQADDSAIFYFFRQGNWEALVKVLDGCTINDRFWVFAAAATNVEYEITVTDTVTGANSIYGNGLGQRPEAITDTEAFATCP